MKVDITSKEMSKKNGMVKTLRKHKPKEYMPSRLVGIKVFV